jgi:superfamily II DNA or RNA helicase
MAADGGEPAALESVEHEAASLRSRKWKRFLRGPDPTLLEDLYVPALSASIRYDRCCSYFSSSVLAAAARGFGKLIERLLAMGDSAPHPAVRLVVNEELAPDDVKALIETGDTSGLERQLLRRLKRPKDVLEKERLKMLGWIVKGGLLEVRVGVMRFGEGIVHAKFGLAIDSSGDAIVFSGSGNESAQGLVANYERLEVSTSWEDPDRYNEYAGEFQTLWEDRHPDVHTVSLPEAVRLRLIKFAPQEPPTAEPSNALARQKAAMVWRFIAEAPYFSDGGATCDATGMVDLWPHQRRVVEETASAWPSGRLLCDEVGLGKTLEAIFALRRLMAGRGVRRALILLPAGLLKQWQAELREKGGLIFPRLEGLNLLVWPDGTEKRVAGLAQALDEDVLLLSRETARTENNIPILLNARPWDLVVLDEAHVARRRKQEEGEFNSATLLLELLRELQLRGRARGFILMSATPMQTHPWEPWDLLAVLGEGGKWLADFANVRNFYLAVSGLKNGFLTVETARKAAGLMASDPDFPAPPDGAPNPKDPESVSKTLAFATPTERGKLAKWLRSGSPLARRMHRNTRATLRRYYKMGLLAQPPPRRRVEDVLFDCEDIAERRVYESIETYINRRYEQLESEKPGKGFVMTVYRRRAASSPLALERSLTRRRDLLQRAAQRLAYDPNLPDSDLSEYLDPLDIPEGERSDRISAALPQDPEKAREELNEVEQILLGIERLGRHDSKRDRFFDELRRVSNDGRSILVFTEYIDTLEYIRESLVTSYGSSVGCYSGDGGALWDGSKWKSVSKTLVSDALFKGELRILICTDAASEGLNLQAAGALINYDLPWNPAKVEQRIGRIDRIGQKHDEVLIVNLFLKDSIDEKVYRALRERCGLFEHFVGAMQPVLAQATRILLGAAVKELPALDSATEQVKADPLAEGTYIESPAEKPDAAVSGLGREDILRALTYLTDSLGCSVRTDRTGAKLIQGSDGIRGRFSTNLKVLELDQKVRPLTPFDENVGKVAEALYRPGERLPLVIGSYQKGAFRVSAAYWVKGRQMAVIGSFAELEAKIADWDGAYPDPDTWQRANQAAGADCKRAVESLETETAAREREGLRAQLAAARLRLLRELGRYLICLQGISGDLNETLYQQMSRDLASAARLRQCLGKLDGYPDWPDDLRGELEEFLRQVAPSQRKAILIGSPLEAALQDPRWQATLS